MIKIAATGHRPDKLLGYGYQSKDNLLRFAFSYVDLIKEPTTIISGMALGWDTAIADACRFLAVPYIAALPCKNQDKLWSKEDRTSYLYLLERAKEVIYISDEEYQPWMMNARNRWMVDNCDEVIALWNGSSGGTMNCVKYAESQKRPITNLWDEFETFKNKLG